ncbi:hypothetical protein; putative exported protein [Thiomonas arsenitoxydans]|uniref:Uncharacterized protein n=1 Tax=Thiomonas arsenitoxydans (strain DSM 22701 / CIP 110005 / 3As) TaxID=426114 RepID=D6CM56_THIA3|nr:hypothetical protein; putative exported protein [Thiomonas arsenitoxydans]
MLLSFCSAATVRQLAASLTSASFALLHPFAPPFKELQNGEALNCARAQSRCQLLFRDLSTLMLKSVW